MYGAEEFAKQFNVSRETLDKFRLYESLLIKWQKKINLIAPSTVKDIWLRHFADSAQIKDNLDIDNKIADIGAGAGFPGLVLAIFGFNVTLIESDQRKSMFLKTIVRALSLENSTVMNQRIEEVDKEFDVVTARALAPLDKLFDMSYPLINQGKFLFLKGANWQGEIDQLQNYKYNMSAESSVSSEDSTILIFENVSRET